MAYQVCFEEHSDIELISELARRVDCRLAGVCDYCSRPGSATPCRFPTRHSLAATDAGRAWLAQHDKEENRG